MTTKPKITITPKEGKIQFDIRQGNQTRWFSVEEETAKELYDILGDVLAEKSVLKIKPFKENIIVKTIEGSGSFVNAVDGNIIITNCNVDIKSLPEEDCSRIDIHQSNIVRKQKDEQDEIDWIEREMAAFLDRKGVERDYECQRTPKVNREEL